MTPIVTPLSEQMRPKSLSEFAGLSQIDQSLVKVLERGTGRIPSLILWGPPGCGKTTLAKLIGSSFDCHFVELSAVLSGVKDLREVVEQAKERVGEIGGKPTLLFVDEIHRFNKGQQDAFLPHVEAGTISLIGATTENPSFYITGALLSRCRVVVLPPLSSEELADIVARASEYLSLAFSESGIKKLIEASGGDARRLLNTVESLAATLSESSDSSKVGKISDDQVVTVLKEQHLLSYDRDGEDHYNITSAFIKSLRGSDADAALYYGFRMLEAGEDPRFLIRRMVIFASEDISNADPRALQVAVATLEAFSLVGLPEGRIPIAQCITYLATAPKSNRSYMAMHRVLKLVKEYPDAQVPLHLRNAPTKLMKGLGYGAEYQYPHDADEGYAAGVRYLPDEVKGEGIYQPSDRGYEKTIKERMEWLKGK